MPISEPYATDTVLTDVLGDHPKVRILSTLLSESRGPLAGNEIAHIAGVDQSTFSDHIEALLAYEIVEQSGTTDNSMMYQINRKSEAAQALKQVDETLVAILAEVEADGRLDLLGGVSGGCRSLPTAPRSHLMRARLTRATMNHLRTRHRRHR